MVHDDGLLFDVCGVLIPDKVGPDSPLKTLRQFGQTFVRSRRRHGDASGEFHRDPLKAERAYLNG